MKLPPLPTDKTDPPATARGKLINAAPVIMTVVATVLAGLSSSEMTSAQYDLSLAAQLQSKAGDQWNFYQGQKLRGAQQHSTLDLMASAGAVRPVAPAALDSALAGTPAAANLGSPSSHQILADLAAGRLPKLTPPPALAPDLEAALAALDGSRSEAEQAALLAPVSNASLAAALHDAQVQALAYDADAKSAGQVIDLAEKQLARPDADPALRRDLMAARIGFNALRYDTESQLNQTVANLYELQVRRSNLSAVRHRRRSQMFFYGMLAAQMGVVIGTLALTHKRRNLLLVFAGAAGAAAVAVAAYVYLGM